MLPVHPGKRFPYLSQYVHHVRSRAGRGAGQFALNSEARVAAAVMSAAFGVALVFSLPPVFGAVLLLAALAFAFHLYRQRTPPTPAERRRQAAREIALRVGRMMELHRLHRDLDPASVVLLEEAARTWDEGRRSGVDHDPAMAELMLAYAPLVPDQPAPRGALEWVSEGVEVLSRQNDPRPAPPFFPEARAIVESMRDQGEEARVAWDELQAESTLRPGDPLRERLRG